VREYPQLLKRWFVFISVKQRRWMIRRTCRTAVRGQSCAAITLLLYAFSAFALPVRLSPEVFLSRPTHARPGAMTLGCEKGTCCTSRCYLDEQGVHHCVPADGDSCECGLTSAKVTPGATSMQDEALVPTPRRNEPDSPPAILARVSLQRPRSSLPMPATPPPKFGSDPLKTACFAA
jgi:hypothetical protein